MKINAEEYAIFVLLFADQLSPIETPEGEVPQ